MSRELHPSTPDIPEYEPRLTRVKVDGIIYPHSGDTASMEFDVPSDLDIEEACAEWVRTGGQVRTFLNGQNAEVNMRALSFPDWLVSQKGARLVPEVIDQSEVA